MNKKTACIGVIATLITAFVSAQEQDSIPTEILKEIVVSDTKFAMSKEKSGKIIEVISSKDLEQKKGQSLATILSQVAGVEVNGNQSFGGKNVGLYIRGGRNRQVVIYIDGVPVNDASAIGLDYDLRLISAQQIERIEIMKGASSTLYGTGAATGVINITLKKTSDEKIGGNAFWNFGTQNTANTSKIAAQDVSQGISVYGKQQKISFVSSLNHTNTNGISEAKGIDFEEDSFSRINLNQKIGFDFSDKLKLNFFAAYDKIKNTFDNPFGGNSFVSDDVFNNSSSEQFRIGFNPKYFYNKGEFNLNTSFSTLDRTINQFNSWTNAVDVYDYFSKNISIDALNKYKLSNSFFAVLGMQYQYVSMAQFDDYTAIRFENAKFSILDPYATLVYNSNFGFNLNAGLRLNTHSLYGNHWVYNINPSYKIQNLPLKFIASYSTAYITPSLYQLYSSFGNLDLKPEENSTIETGFEVELLDKKVKINTIAFYREEENNVDFFTNPITFRSNYNNIDGKYTVKGIEASIDVNVSDKIELKTNYTFMQPEEALSRLIPKHKLNSSIHFMVSNRTNFDVSYQYVSGRNDAFFDMISFANSAVELSKYHLVNANFRHEILKNRLSLFGSISNILNEDFDEVIGYSTRGRNFKIGVDFKF